MEQKHNRYVLITLFVILLVLSFLVIKSYLLPIFLGALLTYMLFPVYKWLEKKTNKPRTSSIIICVLVLIAILVPAIFFFKTFIQEAYVIYITVKTRLATGIIQGCEAQVCESMKEFLNIPEIKFQIEKASKFVTNYAIDKTSELISSIPYIVINGFVMLFSMYYLFIEGPDLVQRIGFYLSMKQKEYARIIRRLQEVTKGILYGYVLVAFLQGFLGGIGFLIFGVHSPIFWGIVMGFFALIPLLGTGIVWGPAALLLLLDGLSQNSNSMIFKGLGLFAYGLLIVSSVDNLIRPKIISDKAKIHPAIILVGILGGISVFGMFGVIIGPMILSLVAIIIENYISKKPSKKQIKKIFGDDDSNNKTENTKEFENKIIDELNKKEEENKEK